jgi:phosphoglucosamine mutase
MSKELFGTDGIRGLPGEFPLDDQTLYWVGRSIGGYLRLRNDHPRVLIGIDTRESGAHIASEIAAGLAEEGIRNSFAGVITTPGVACLVRKEGFAAGVVISASHNP